MEAEILWPPCCQNSTFEARQRGAAYVVTVLVVFELIFVLILILNLLIFRVRDIGAM
jgi:hypothetical protein